MSEEHTFLKLRVFGSSDCEKCKMTKKAMKHHGLDFDFIDIEDSKNKKLCDFFDVDELPLVQVLDSKTNAVIAFHAGWIDPMSLLKRAASVLKTKFDSEKTEPFNLAKIKKNQRCSECYD